MPKKMARTNENDSGTYPEIDKLASDIFAMYKPPNIEDSHSMFDFELQAKSFEAPDLDEIGTDFLLANRELFMNTSEINQFIPFGWTFAEDNFNTDYEVMQNKNPITKPGDIWQMGKHRLMCGNSTDIYAVIKLMDGKTARMVFTDPFWNTVYGSEKRLGRMQRQIFSDTMSPDDLCKMLLAALKAMASVCESGTPAYVVMSVKEVAIFMNATNKAGFHWRNTIIWEKESVSLRKKDYHSKYEPIWYGWLNGEKCLCPVRDREESDYWKFDWLAIGWGDLHLGIKPIALVSKAVNNSSHSGDVILDLFGGSGTTLIAAEQTGRVCYMMEIDPSYSDAIVNRYIKHKKSNEDVFLIRNGKRFAIGEVPQIQ